MFDYFDSITLQDLQQLGAGLLVTLQVAFFSICFSFILGMVLGIVRFTGIRFFSKLAQIYIEIIRNLPLLLIIFFTYFYLAETNLGQISITSSVILSMTIFTSALVAEIVRGGLDSVPKGQMEAAISQGLTYFQALYHIIVPQAFRRIIPPMVSQFVTLIKDTSMAAGISLPELMHETQMIYNVQYDKQIPLIFLAVLIYFIINYALSFGGRKLEKRFAS